MRNFSIIPNSSQSAIEQYSDFLTREVYSKMQPYDVNDPLFLQQLGVLQAEGIRRAINNNSAISYSGFQGTNATIENSTNYIGNKIGSVANMLTSCLDKGFTTLNSSLIKIDSGIEIANVHLSNINRGVNTANTHLSNINADIQNVNNNLIVLGKLVGQGFSMLHNQLSQSNKQLGQILQELKIPETQRERRYRIEEGTKYLTLALQNGDTLYFEDAFDEFNTALTFEKKDWFSWFNVGLIHLRSKEHVNPQKAIDAFKRTVHYGQAEITYTKNVNLEHKIDEAYLYMAEAYYLQQEYKSAISETEQCLHAKDKANFMRVKYLSATNENQNKQIATEILSKLINQNPYITLQVLEDDDILQNEQIINLLEKIRAEKNKEAKSILTKIKCEDNQTVNKIKELISTNAFLDVHEALKLAKSLFNAMTERIDNANKSLERLKREIHDKHSIAKEVGIIEDLISKKNSDDAISAANMTNKILNQLDNITNCCNDKRQLISVLQHLLKEAPIYIIKELKGRDVKFVKEVDKIELVDPYDGLYADFDVDTYERRTVTTTFYYKLNDIIREIRK